jgi:hypothetical protein
MIDNALRIHVDGISAERHLPNEIEELRSSDAGHEASEKLLQMRVQALMQRIEVLMEMVGVLGTSKPPSGGGPHGSSS